MKLSSSLAFLLLAFGCGDIIKTKDPRTDRKPYQPTTLTDQTGSCPYYPGVWKGRCTGQNQDLARVLTLDIAQTGCTLFALNSVAVYAIDEERNYKQGDKPVKSRAAWLNAERTRLELQEEWDEAAGKKARTLTVDIQKGEAVETLRQVTGDDQAAGIHSCMYQRS